MSINNIKTLSLNPHFFALLLQNFLTGYNQQCKLRDVFLAFPILMYKDSRDRLEHANKNSSFDSLFKNQVEIVDNANISAKTCLSGYKQRYDYNKNFCKQALIILSSENKIYIHDDSVDLIKKIDYKDFNGENRIWFRCSYYLGEVFVKATPEQISYYLGVNLE